MAKLKAPSENNRYYKHVNFGGLNECIIINKNNGSCLPNCVGYCWGRAFEVTKKRPSLSRRNACEWWRYTTDGYERSSKPQKNSIMCFRGGSKGYGHVAFVEEVKSDGTVITSESNYGGLRWVTKERKPPYNMNGLMLQGFIHLTGIDYNTEEKGDENVTHKEAVEVIAKEVIKGKYGNGEERKEKLYKEVQNKVNELMNQ